MNFSQEVKKPDEVVAGLLMKTYSPSSWRLRMKKMMPMMMPMKARAPRIPPITAPDDGPGVTGLCSSVKKEQRQRARILIAIHLKSMLWLLALKCCIIFVFLCVW